MLVVYPVTRTILSNKTYLKTPFMRVLGAISFLVLIATLELYYTHYGETAEVNYFQVLDLASDATTAQVKKQYKLMYVCF